MELVLENLNGIAYGLRTGLHYTSIMQHEPVNISPETFSIVKHFFGQVHISRFPTPWFHATLYTYLEASRPMRDRCLDFIHANKLRFEAFGGYSLLLTLMEFVFPFLIDLVQFAS